MFGNNHAKALQDVGVTAINGKAGVKTQIYDGLKEARKSKDALPNYVSFFVLCKHDTTQKITEKHMEFHMTVFTVRSSGRDKKDGLYFDPSGFEYPIPHWLRDLPLPKFENFIRSYGNKSQIEDCVYQCLKYIIGLVTGEIEFDINEKS